MSEQPDVVELVERASDAGGVSIELQRRGNVFEVVQGGVRTMYSDAERNESQLAELTLAPLQGRDDINVLVAGAGLGRVVKALLANRGVKRVDVVDPWPPLYKWHEAELKEVSGGALVDPRVHRHQGELADLIRARAKLPGAPPEGWLAIVLDLDEGPTRLTRPSHAGLYEDDGLRALVDALVPGGVLATWSPHKEVELLQRMGSHLQQVAEVVVPVDVLGDSSLDYIYRGRRPPRVGQPAVPGGTSGGAVN